MTGGRFFDRDQLRRPADLLKTPAMSDWSEDERLRALHRLDILDTKPEESFEEIVKAAARAFGMPMAAISLVDRNRQWFKAQVGLGVPETARDLSFCAHAIRGDGVMIVPDATRDTRFVDNGLVTGDPSLRFYAGAVIRSEDGLPLGALCVLDTSAHPTGLTQEQAALLQTLADQVSEQLRLRSLVRLHEANAARQAHAIEATRHREDRLLRALGSGAVGWWEWDVPNDIVIGSPDLALDFGLDPQVAAEGAPIDVFFAHVHPLDRPDLTASVREAVETGAPFREQYRILHPDGRVIWILARGRCLREDAGGPGFFPGVALDVTERVEAERRHRESDLRRELAMTAARLGSWDHDLAQGIRRYDARALALLGLNAEESRDVANTYRVVHPDDREPLERATRAAIEPSRIGPFRETFRVVDRETGEIRWLAATGRTDFQNGICSRFIGVLEDVTEERTAEEHRRMLTNEMTHRVKNTLAVVGSIVDASIRSAEDLPGARREVTSRLASFAKAHDLLIAESWLSAEVRTIVQQATQALGLPEQRLELQGPSLRLAPKPALQLSLALHELGTNAIKYGALSNDTGRIRIRWATDGAPDPTFTLEWVERGGPPVDPPRRKGFGTRLVEAATAAEFRGTSILDYQPAGLQWHLAAPFSGVSGDGAGQ